jgi:putative transposase
MTTNNEIYHIINRGTDKRKIFLDDKDYLRFIHDLFEFNDEKPAFNIGYNFKNQYIDVKRQYIKKREPRKLLVEILAFCLMPNHYHLLIKPLTKNSKSEFIKKLNGGYAKYFNNKYERSGRLFEGKYKSILIKNESHFIHILYYIHLNPLDLIVSEWRERNILTSDVNKIMKFLENYRWSSFLDYIGKKNFPSVTQREFLNNFFEGPENHKKSILKWLKEMNLEEIKEITLE